MHDSYWESSRTNAQPPEEYRGNHIRVYHIRLLQESIIRFEKVYKTFKMYVKKTNKNFFLIILK